MSIEYYRNIDISRVANNVVIIPSYRGGLGL